MPEIERESEMTRAEVADSLREFADNLDTDSDAESPIGEETDAFGTDDRVTVIVGNESATVNPPDAIDFGVEVDSATGDSSLIGDDREAVIHFEIRWAVEEASDDGEIEIK